MSLIHDALKEMETSASAEKAPAVGVPTVSVAHGTGLRLGSGSLGGALAGVVVGVGVATICVAIWQVYAVAQPAPAPVALSEPAQIATPPAAAVARVMAQPQGAAVAAADNTGPATPVLFKAEEGHATGPRHIVTKPRHHHVRHAAAVPPEPAQSGPAEPSEAELFQSFNTALANHDLAQARVLLGRLEGRMPTNSVTLMRARAWLAVQSGEPEKAMQEYAQILRRLPEDENASLNLAALENQAGHRSKARKIVNNLLVHNPDSVRANRMLATLREGDR